MEGAWVADVIAGLLGGAAAEALGIFELRRRKPSEMPEWLHSRVYWGSFVGLTILGGVVVFMYAWSGISLTPLLAFNIGASAPLIVQQGWETRGDYNPGKVG